MSESGAFPVSVDGELRPAGSAPAAAEESHAGVFETLLVEDGHAYFVREHVDRMQRGARTLSIPWPLARDPAALLAEYARALDAPRVVARLALTAGAPRSGPQVRITARAPEPVPAPGVLLLFSARTVRTGDPLTSIKSTDRPVYTLAREEARAAGVWDALLGNDAGGLAETSVANLYLVAGHDLRTPELAAGCLPGVVRGLLLTALAEAEPLEPGDGRALALREEAIALDELWGAEEVFATNSVGGVIPVAGILAPAGGVHALPGAEGPVAAAAAVRLAELAARDRAGRNPSRSGR